VLSVADMVLDRAAYRAARPGRRAEAIALRSGRRLHLGDLVTLEVENLETLRYQAQEMLYAEGVTAEPLAAEELAAYERLLPSRTSFTATMMVEIPDPDRVRDELVRLAGLHDSIALRVGGSTYPAVDVPPPGEAPTERTFSVHFLRFALTDEAVAALAAGGAAEVVAQHPQYAASTPLPAALAQALVAEMAAA
jgi:hypothetical protein